MMKFKFRFVKVTLKNLKAIEPPFISVDLLDDLKQLNLDNVEKISGPGAKSEVIKLASSYFGLEKKTKR